MSKWGALQLLQGKKTKKQNTKHLMKSAIKCGCFSSLTALRRKEELITEKKRSRKQNLAMQADTSSASNLGKQSLFCKQRK